MELLELLVFHRLGTGAGPGGGLGFLRIDALERDSGIRGSEQAAMTRDDER